MVWLTRFLPFLSSGSLSGVSSFLSKNFKWILLGGGVIAAFYFLRNLFKDDRGAFLRLGGAASEEIKSTALKVAHALGTLDSLNWWESNTESRQVYELLKDLTPKDFGKVAKIYPEFTNRGKSLQADIVTFVSSRYVEKLDHLI